MTGRLGSKVPDMQGITLKDRDLPLGNIITDLNEYIEPHCAGNRLNMCAADKAGFLLGAVLDQDAEVDPPPAGA